MDYIILHYHQQLYLDELTTSTHQDGTCTAQKCPNDGSYHRLGLRYAHYEFNVTTTATNHHNWRRMGAWDLSRALMYVFFLFYFFFFYTNMNFLLNRHHHQLDCPKSGPGPGGPRSRRDRTPNVRVQVQIWVDLDPNYRSRSSWWVDQT